MYPGKNLKDVECIWMESGYVSYKLCDRNFDCENCPFDKSFRERKNEKTFSGEENNKNSFTGGENSFPSDRIYFPNHLWLKNITEHKYELGITKFGQLSLQNYSSFQLPKEGTLIESNKPLFWLLGRWGVISVISPFDGSVIKINKNTSNIDFFSHNCYEYCLMEVKVEIASIKPYHLNADEYKKFISEEYSELTQQHLNKELQMNVGQTMYDGGEINPRFFSSISEKELKQFLTKMFKI